MRRGRWVVAVALGLMVLRGALAATPTDVEYRFAKGLADDLGYYDLAIERFLGVREKLKPEEKEYLQVGLDLVDAYINAAYEETPSRGKLDLSAKAVGEIDNLIKRRKDPDEELLLLMRLGQLHLDRGLLVTDQLERKPDDIDHARLSTAATQSFAAAKAAFEKAATAYGTFAAAVLEKAKKTKPSDADLRKRDFSIEQEIIARSEIGWTNFRMAALQKQLGNDAARKAALQDAVKIFSDISAKHTDILAGVSALLGKGRAYQEMGDAKNALAAYQAVGNIPMDKGAAPLHESAYYQMAEVLRGQAKYAEAIAALKRSADIGERIPRTRSVAANTLRMSLAKTFAAAGGDFEKKAAAAEKAKKAREAEALKEKAEQHYEEAIAQVKPLTRAGSGYAREAYRLMGAWREKAGGGGAMSAADWYADGERLYQAGDYLKAADAYREAVRVSSAANVQIERNAWVQMGQAYVKAGSKDKQYYYHAGLVLGHAAKRFPDAAFAEKAAVYSAMLLGANYARPGRTWVETDAYIESQYYLILNYPTNPSALRAALRVADLMRGRGRYLEAAASYEKVQKSSPLYERAQFFAGDSAWTYYLRHPGKDSEPHRRRAKEQFIRFIAWAKDAPKASEKQALMRSHYVARAKLRLADIYLDPAEKAPTKALDTLARFATTHAIQTELIPQAVFSRVRASVDLMQLDAAVKDLQTLIAKYPDFSDNALACRIVGSAYVDRAKKLTDAGADATQVAAAKRAAGTWLTKSLAVKEDQSLDDYTLIARLLYQAESYGGAAGAFQKIITRFGKDPKNEALIWSAREWLAISRMKTGEWAEAVAGFRQVIAEFPTVMKLRRRLGLSLESLAEGKTLSRMDRKKHLSEAVIEWRKVERTQRQGTEPWFEARYHIARDLALIDSKEQAYKTIATTAIGYPTLGGDNYRTQYDALIKEHLQKYAADYEKLMNQAQPADD